jgi:hypothetical protein
MDRTGEAPAYRGFSFGPAGGERLFDKDACAPRHEPLGLSPPNIRLRLPGPVLPRFHWAEFEGRNYRRSSEFVGQCREKCEQIRNRVALEKWRLSHRRSKRRRERIERHGRSHAAISDRPHSNPTRDHDLC